MKKSILALTACTFIIIALFTSYNIPAEKVENAQKNVIVENKNLDKANKEYLVVIEKFKKETEDKFAANDQNIAEFKTRIEHERKETKADYKKKVVELEQKNSNINKEMANYKTEMANYKTKEKEKWKIFKVEFNQNIDSNSVVKKQ